MVPEQTRLPRKQVSGQSSGLQGAGEHLQVAPTHPARGWLLGQGAHGTLLELQTKVHTKLRKHRGAAPTRAFPWLKAAITAFTMKTLCLRSVNPREVMMGVGDGVASVIILTFTKRPGPHADFYKEARPPC